MLETIRKHTGFCEQGSESNIGDIVTEFSSCDRNKPTLREVLAEFSTIMTPYPTMREVLVEFGTKNIHVNHP